MSKFKNFCKEFIQDEDGLTVVEYVVGAGLLVGGLTVIFSNLGTSLSTALNNAIDGIGS